MSRFRTALALAAVLFCGGLASSCASSVSNIQHLKQELGGRASFELKCPKEKLQFRCLNENCDEAGVAGCGRRVVYLWIRKNSGGRWVANSSASE